jgi:hypothetical protein
MGFVARCNIFLALNLALSFVFDMTSNVVFPGRESIRLRDDIHGLFVLAGIVAAIWYLALLGNIAFSYASARYRTRQR